MLIEELKELIPRAYEQKQREMHEGMLQLQDARHATQGAQVGRASTATGALGSESSEVMKDTAVLKFELARIIKTRSSK